MSETMDCGRVRELLVDYLNNEMSEDRRMLVSDHLSGCTACAMEMEALAAAETKLRQAYSEVAAGVSPSPGVWEAIKHNTVDSIKAGVSVWERIAPKLKWAYAWRRPVWRGAVAAAAALSVALVVVLNTGPVPLWTAAEQRAIDIATSDPAIQALLDGEGVVYEVIPVSGEGGSVYYQIAIVASSRDVDSREGTGIADLLAGDFEEKSANYCDALSDTGQVNMIVNPATFSVVAYEQSEVDCLTFDEIQDAADIAESDIRIEGAQVVNVSLMNNYDAEQQSFTDEMVVWVRLSLNGEIYFAQVDLDQGKVVKLIEGGTE